MDWLNIVLQGVLVGGLFALLGAGLSVVFGVMRVANLAHGDFSIVAAYVAVSASDLLGINPAVSLLIATPLLFAVGYGLQRGILNGVLERAGDAVPVILITFGLSIILQNALLDRYTADIRGLELGSFETASISVSDQLSIGWFPLATFAASVVVFTGLSLLFNHTRFGRGLRAATDDALAARYSGVDTRRTYAVALGIGVAAAGIAGIFLGIRTSFGPFTGPVRLTFAFEAVAIGGLGSLWGTFWGGLLLGVAQGVGARFDPGYGVLAGHLLFLAVIAIRPRGLFGGRAVA